MPKDIQAFPNIGNYLACQGDPAEAVAIIKNTLGGRQLTPMDLDTARVPSGGAITWEVPGLTGEPESAKTIEGIILHFIKGRRYWTKKMGQGESAPPDCYSDDGIAGYGEPGGFCAVCPLSVMGSGENGGEACKQRRVLFVLQPASVVPMVVQVPTMSIRPLEQYMLRLAGQGIPVWAVTTKLGLVKKTQRKGGQSYSQILPTVGVRLAPAEVQHLKALGEHLRPLLAPVSTQMQEQTDGDEDGALR